MAVEFSLWTLKEQKEKLLEEKARLESEAPKESARIITRLTHQIADLDFSIEVLETYLD